MKLQHGGHAMLSIWAGVLSNNKVMVLCREMPQEDDELLPADRRAAVICSTCKQALTR